MARIIVVGSGFAGLSAAARLAKLRHDVTVLERDAEPGGLLLGRTIGDRRWAAGPDSVTLPGVFRDLFRKSGRPMDALIAISPSGPRRHLVGARWPRRATELDLPFGTRSAQHDAVTAALGSDPWSPWVDELADPWDTVRRTVFEAVHAGAPVAEAPFADRSLRQVARAAGDPRLRRIGAELPGVDESGPSVLAVWHYVERNFGRWRFDGGSAGLATALLTRLRERKVSVETGVEVAEPAVSSGVVDGVVLADGSHRAADVVVWAVGSGPSTSRALTAVRLSGADVPEDLVVHGRDVVRGWRSDDDGWVLEAPTGVDPLEELARVGLDLRPHVTWRETVPAPPVLTELPLAARSPRDGLWLVGAAAAPGAGLEITGMGTAALAAHLGAAPR
ncbi:phytoene desaturase family protein [Aeromicrobium choanae]|uniref:phytoene desaturase family protein n=1 Tax=Aeromicrobium choanae TaxID=1736691 RepID=UPI0015608EBC|nr:FAD-dependent oxidoreductase [Aeromicrobium choanae]